MPVKAAVTPRLQARGLDLDVSPQAFGFLRRSDSIAEDAVALRERMVEDGYLYLPGLLHRDEVIEARKVVTDRLATQGFLDPEYDPMEGVMKPRSGNPYFKADLARKNTPLLRVLYNGPMMALFTRFLGGPVRHYDYTWFRAVGAGPGTAPHCDVVYMGRGTHQLYTAWTPIADISLELGGLMILENSHKRTDITGEYLEQDVDSYCENGPNAEKVKSGEVSWEHWQTHQPWDGALTHDPVTLRNQFGGRWLTSPEYRMGDVLIFSMRTVHASIDNQTNRIRLSSDTRYQLASEPVDERWVGENPISHGLAAKRGRIC